MSVEEQKIFDDFPQADCHTCHNYWYDQCDGVPVNLKRNCSSFIATRTYDIPKQINTLYNALKSLNKHIIVIYILLAVYFFIEFITELIS